MIEYPKMIYRGEGYDDWKVVANAEEERAAQAEGFGVSSEKAEPEVPTAPKRRGRPPKVVTP